MTKNENEWEIDNLPNRLTIFRIVLIPIIAASLISCELSLVKPIVIHYLGYLAAWTFVVASITDFFDGHIARKQNIVTVFGSFLDPIADKFLVITSLILLHGLSRIPTILVIILVLRELYITALRLLAQEKNIQVPVNDIGKWKTTFQMIGIPMLMANDRPWGIPLPEIGIISIYISSLFSVYSATQYSLSLLAKIKTVRAEKKQLKKQSIEKKGI